MRTVIPIESYSNKLTIAVNIDYVGHSDLILTRYSDNKQYIVTDIKGRCKMQNGLYIFTFKALPPDLYTLQTTNLERNSYSDKIEVYVTGDARKKILYKILMLQNRDILESPYKELMSSIKKDEDVYHIISNIIQFYLNDINTANTTKIDYIAKLSIALEGYCTYLTGFSNLNNSIKLSGYNGIYTARQSYMANQIHICSQLPNNLHKMQHKYCNKDNTISLPENSISYVYSCAVNGEINSFYVLYTSIAVARQKIFQLKQSIKHDANNILISSVKYPTAYLQFNTEEQKDLSVMASLKSLANIIAPPMLNIINGVKLEIEFIDYGNALKLGKVIYLNIIETELLQDKTYRHLQIKNQISEYYLNDLFMNKQDHYIYWLEADNGIKLTRPLPFVINDRQQASYNERIVSFRQYEYLEHFLPYVGAKYINIMTLAKQWLTNNIFTSIYQTFINDIGQSLKDIIPVTKNYDNICLLRTIYEDYLIYANLLDRKTCPLYYYYYKEFRLEMPPAENTVYVVHSYAKTPYKFNSIVLKSNDRQSTSYKLYNIDYAAVMTISANTGKVSGFSIIDNTAIITNGLPYIYNFFTEMRCIAQ